eukprot:scaffold31008_cov26-Tisochrysis_lutea.AAC.1
MKSTIIIIRNAYNTYTPAKGATPTMSSYANTPTAQESTELVYCSDLLVLFSWGRFLGGQRSTSGALRACVRACTLTDVAGSFQALLKKGLLKVS